MGRARTLATYAALAVAPWPLAYAALSPPFTRLYRRRAIEYALYVVLYAAVTLSVALTARSLLIPIALAALAGTVVQAWIARHSWAGARRLPPGALPAIPVASIVDRRFIGRQLERHGPVTKTNLLTALQPVVCVEGLRRGAALLNEHRASLEWVGMRFDDLIPAGFLRTMKPHDHARYKNLFRSALSDELVAGCATAFSAYAADAVERLAADGRERTIDPRPALDRYATRSLMKLLLGLSPGDEGFDEVERLYVEPGPLHNPSTSGGGAEELRDAARRVVMTASRASTAAGQSQVAESLVGRLREQDRSALDDPNVALNVVFLLSTTSYDVTGLLHWIVKMLGDNPEWCRRIRRDPSLCRCVVQETLRLAQSEFILRRVTSDVEVDGYVVPKGWYLRVCVQESHRSAATFEEPGRFDPLRFASHRYSRAEYAPFGMLEHVCLGVETTLRVCAAFVDAYSMHDWKLAADGRLEFDGFHWRPSHKLRIALPAGV